MRTKLDPHLIAETNGNANPKQIYQQGNLRVTVLAPELIRVEFDRYGRFLDKATQAVWFRDLGECAYSVTQSPPHLIVSTEKMSCYIHTKRKTVNFCEIDGCRVPADNRDNLKGTYRTLDMARGAVPLGKGIIGRKGVAVMADKSLILDSDGTCKARPREKDLYCFATSDHRRALHLFYQITGCLLYTSPSPRD